MLYKRPRSALLRLYILFLTAFSSLNSFSAIVSVEGDNYIFTYDNSTLFGNANVINDSIFFLPTNFSAVSLNQQGAVLITDIIDIEVEVKPGSSKLIDGFSLFEQGDYRLHGTGSSVDVATYVQVTSFASICNSFLLVPCFLVSDVLTPNQSFSNTEALDDLNTLATWELSAFVDLDSNQYWGNDIHVNLRLQNNLYATAMSQGDLAQIQKKFGGLGVQVHSEVPVPAAAWLFISALIALSSARQKGYK